jgi:hypothetical protein
MKKNLTLAVMAMGFSFLAQAQTSTFYGYFSPTGSKLVPHIEPKGSKDMIKPNFKGKELYEVDIQPTHYPDWVWQQHENQEKVSTATLNWQVQGVGASISPPDPSGDADNQYYIQGTNSGGGGTYKIFNKNTGAAITGTLTMQSLGGPSGLGDPIVLYHKPAQRWFLTEFSSSGNKLLVHVSQSSNPQGAYYTYQFTCPSFPDYPKYSIVESNDALVVSTNEGGPPTLYAMRLSSLLAGTTSPFIGVDIGYSLNGFGFQSITPVDLEGDNAAPTGMKPLFVRHRDDESHSNGSPDSASNDWIELWEMTINWGGNSATVAKIQDIAVTEFDSDLCGLVSFSCIQQPTASPNQDLDPLRETVMYKAPMRVFTDHQAIVLAWATDVSGTNRAGIRWAEIRRDAGSLGNWSLYQEGTYAPGTTNRWMPGINMDEDGNIMMAYSTSSQNAGDFPSIKFTGRRACDPLGEMTVPETTIKQGLSSRTSNTRWGDYHHLSIDPYNDSVFYFTGVYMEASNAIRTNISSFQMDPAASDAGIIEVFQQTPGTICGSATIVGVVIQNKGTGSINSGTIEWDVDGGTASTENYTSSQLSGTGDIDTIYINVSGLGVGANTVNFNSTGVNGTVPDDVTCNDLASLTITTGSGSLSVTANINNEPSCSPGNDGQITVVPTGGTAPYTFTFDGGAPQSTGIFTGISVGTYNYTVTDGSGCAGSGSVALSNSTTVNAIAGLASPILCNGDSNGSFSIAASGGSPSYTYSIDGTNFQSSNVFNGLSANTYNVIVKDQNGCEGSTSIALNEPASLNVNAIPIAVNCKGANDGQITISVSGGIPGYNYSIDGTNYSSNNLITGLAPGSYTVYVQDNNGCVSTFNTTITEPTQVNASAAGTPSSGNDGTITITGTGGNSPYQYSIDGTNYQSGALFTGLTPGTYTAYVQDNNGCISQTSVVVASTTGLEEQSLLLVSLYPNPTDGELNIVIDGVIGVSVNAKIFNMAGQVVSEFNLPVVNGKVDHQVSLSKKIAAGNYYIGFYDAVALPIVTQFVKK